VFLRGRPHPPEVDVHPIVDNQATHKHRKVRTWLAQRPRYQVHYTPTYSSWLHQVERWFALITRRAIRRDSFRSVRELVEKIDSFVEHYNRSQGPFAWTATADSMLGKTRLCSRIPGQHAGELSTDVHRDASVHVQLDDNIAVAAACIARGSNIDHRQQLLILWPQTTVRQMGSAAWEFTARTECI